MTTDPVIEIAKELARQVPLKEAYADAAAPAARVVGSTFEDIAKTIRLALAPIQITAALQDRLLRFIDRAIRDIPDSRRITPAPQIVGPVIEGVKYKVEGTPIDEMFSQLLASASDTDRVADAHPAFPQLIRQLSADEAVLLNKLHGRGTPHYLRRVTAKLNAAASRFHDFQIVLDQFPKEYLGYPANLDFYIDHLWSLGLAGLFKSDEKAISSGGTQTGTNITNEYRLTDFGQRFMRATTPIATSSR